MRTFFIALITLFLSLSVAAQQDPLEFIIAGDDSYAKIVARGDAHFAAKHPGKTATELSLGEHRDGKFVKWQRWKHYWAERLNADGTLGSPVAYFLEQQRKGGSPGGSEKVLQPYENVAWTNINYTDYITGQIGLGRTDDIAFHPTDPNTFYVAANRGGIWKTTDGGQTYAPMSDELPTLDARSLIVDQANPDIIYALFNLIGVYKSEDAGATWEPTALANDPAFSRSLNTMTADPADPQRILVAGYWGTYLTTDGFATFSKVSDAGTYFIRHQPGDVNTVLATGRDGTILRSTDRGTTWAAGQTLNGNWPWLEFSQLDPDHVYATTGSLVYESTDAGVTWTQIVTDGTDGAPFIVAHNSRDTLFKGYFDLYRSNDGGQSWTQIMDWLGAGGLESIHVDTRRLRTNPLEPDNIYICNDGGVYRYSISQNTFTSLCDGLVITQYYDIAVSQTDANVVGGGSQDNGNVFRQSDGSWLQYATTGDGMNQAIDPTDAGIRYWSYQNGGLRRWQNGSNANIRPGLTGGAWQAPYRLDPNNPARIVWANDTIYESLDRGDNWTAIGFNLAGTADANEMAIAPTNSERIYVSFGDRLFVKSTVGDTWTERSLPAGASDLEVDPYNEDRVYISRPGYTAGEKVYVSDDAGATWQNISRNLPNLSIAALETYRDIPGAIFVGSDDGVYYTDSLLNGWQRYGNMPNARVEDIEIQYAAQLIRVGTYGRGVLEAPIIVETCTAASADSDGDGQCDFIDECPNFNNNLIGTACDDGDPFSDGEIYDTECGCSGGRSNLSYCAGAGSTNTGSDYLDRVLLNDLESTSGKTQYSDFTDRSATLEMGQDYTMTVGFRATFGIDRAHAWIDWNRDGVFDANEHLDFSVPDADNLAFAVINVPTIVPGVTTMRVRGVYSTTHNDPCGNAFGEVEDYTVRVICADGDVNCRALPLEFNSLSAIALGKTNALVSWSTQTERNVSHYLVERSENGISFTPVDELQARNTARADYEFIDESVPGRFAYYRVTGVDFDGAQTVSPSRRVDFFSSDDVNVQLYPNPVGQDELTLNWQQNEEDANVRWLVYNQWGQEIASGSPAARVGENLAVVNLAKLPAGVYLLRLRGTDFDWTGHFVRR